jgi:hypothetical protein
MAGSVVVPIRPRTFESSIGDISHCFEDAISAWDGGKMDGFDQEKAEVVSQVPREFTPIKAKYPPSTFTKSKPATPPDIE